MLVDEARREGLEVLVGGEEGGGHGEERADRDAPPVADAHDPGHVGVRHERRDLPLLLPAAVEQELEGRLQLGGDGVEEARVGGGAAVLGGDDVGDGAQADAGRRRGGGGGAEQAEPLLGDDDRGRDAVAGGEEAARSA